MAERNRKIIAVVGGTPFDTALGCRLVLELGMLADGYPLASSPDEQNELQFFDTPELHQRLEQTVKKLKQGSYAALLIFCTSLAMVVDHERLSSLTKLPIVTPVESLERFAHKFDRFLVMAANGRSLYGIEKIILRVNRSARILALSNLSVVNSIEDGLAPEQIFNAFGFDVVIDWANNQSVQSILLGCTHLTIMYQLVASNSTIPVVDIGRETAGCLTSILAK